MNPTEAVGSHRDAAVALEGGRAALGRGSWTEAASAFMQAAELAADPSEALAEAWTGFGLASYWLGDGAAATAAHERAFRQYGALDRKHAAARVALWLTDEQLTFFGATAVANGWLEQAERLLTDAPTSAEHAWLRAYRGHYALLVLDQAERALELALEGQVLARAVGASDAELVTVALEGLALVSLGDVQRGMTRLDEASAAAVSREPTDLNAVAWACCYLVHGCENVRDLARAAEWCQRVLAFCQRWGLAPVYASCRMNYAAVLMRRGEWEAAESELRSAGDEPHGSSPGLERLRQVRLGELRLRQGRLDEAEPLFQGAGEDLLAIVGRAAIALERGEPAAASDLSDRALRLLPPDSRTDRADPLLIRVRAAAALADLDRASADARELVETADRIGTAPFRALAASARGVVAAASGDAAGAARAFEDAVVHNDRGGARYDAALARLELAAVLAALGRHDTARSEAGHARDVFLSLGAARDLERAESLLRGWSAAPAGQDVPLTDRELEVLRLVARGYANRRIANELFISPHTVKRHLANILRKLDCSSRAAAVAHVTRLGAL